MIRPWGLAMILTEANLITPHCCLSTGKDQLITCLTTIVGHNPKALVRRSDNHPRRRLGSIAMS